MKLGNSQGTLHKMDLVKSKFMLWSYQIASGMSFVTNLGIIHRNISLRNILLSETFSIKISSFDKSIILETELDFQKLRDYYNVISINIKVISYHERLCYVKCKGIII